MKVRPYTNMCQSFYGPAVGTWMALDLRLTTLQGSINLAIKKNLVGFDNLMRACCTYVFSAIHEFHILSQLFINYFVQNFESILCI